MRLALLVLLAACGTTPDSDDVDTDLADTDLDAQGWVDTLDAQGPWKVGYRTVDMSYPDPAGEGDRSVRVLVWYPTEVSDGPITSFLGANAAQGVQQDVAVAPGTFPLAVFSHGHQGDPANATHLMAHLASHGWVAAAPTHTGNTLLDDPTRTTAIYLQRPKDVSATLDLLLDTDPVFADHTDGRVYAFGHSFGGYNTFLLAGATWAIDHWKPLCEGADDDTVCNGWNATVAAGLAEDLSDARVLAATTLSGGNWGQIREAGFATVNRPLLQVSGALDSSVSNVDSSDPIWRDLPVGGRVRVDLAHGDHQSYTDFAGVVGIPGTDADALDGPRALRLVRVYLAAFGAKHVLGAEGLDAVLDGSFVVDEDCTVSVK